MRYTSSATTTFCSRGQAVKSDPTLLKWYRVINRRFFGGACPDRVCVRWADPDEGESVRWEKKYFGQASLSEDDEQHDFQIVLSRPLNKQWLVRISTLVHEMCHLATRLKDDHGPAFERWRKHVGDRGIFKKHALRKGRTLF
jgi:SprT-like family